MSDDKIVTFRGNQPEPVEPPEEYVLVCTRCDNTTFKLFAGGKITCAFCEVHVTSADPEDHKEWSEVVGDVGEKDKVRASDPHDKVVTQSHIGDASRACEFVSRLINKWAAAGELCMLVGYNRNGHGQHWFDIVTEDQREWVMEKFEEVRKTLEKFDISVPFKQTIIPVDEKSDGPDET